MITRSDTSDESTQILARRVVAAAAAALLVITACACARPVSHTVHVKNEDNVDLKVRIDTSDDCCHWEEQVVAAGTKTVQIRSDRDLVLHVTVTSAEGGVLEQSGGYMSGFIGPDEARYGTCVMVSRRQVAIETCTR